MNMYSLNTPDEMIVEMPAMIAVDLGKTVVIGSTDGQVKPASSGQMPIGISLTDGGEICKVKVKGFVDVKYTGSTGPAVGFVAMVSDSTGSLRAAGSGENGRPCIVLSRDDVAKTMRVLLM